MEEDASGTITSNARSLNDASGTTWDIQCFTYDAMGELVNAGTSNITPDGKATGCKSASGERRAASSKTWGHRTDYEASTGPVADSPDSSTDVSSPGTSMSSPLTAAAPDSATLATGRFVARRRHEVAGGDSAVLPSGKPSQCSSSTIRTPLPTARG
ncbi:hypothetical protein [Streptomyces aquilus]|uniref:hypothetical protein n=1 Tax=Streptomyces aquilus TaxID=2548456 RepID=UPI001416FD79|nr:hypothetical protein [Streptomyces aquilus]